MSYELKIIDIPNKKDLKQKRKCRPKINWTDEMINRLKSEFPVRFNKDLAKDLGIGWRSLVRKARELNINKEPGFLEKNRSVISEMATKAHPPHPFKGVKGWNVPNSQKTRFKPGSISAMNDPLIVKKVHDKRNETIRKEKLRIKYDMPQKTNLRLT